MKRLQRWRRGGGRLAEARQLDPDLFENAVHFHIDGYAYGIGKTERVGRAVALDRNPAQAEEYGTVVTARVAAHPKLPERAAGKQIADAGRQRMTEGRLEEFAEELGSSLRGLDGDVAGEPVGDDDIDGSRRNVVTLDKPVKMDRGNGCAQSSAGAADGIVPLEILRPDVEQPDC